LLLVAGAGQETAMDSGSSGLAGSQWRWQRTLMHDGTVFVPDDSGIYTVTFGEDGSVAIQADCNQVLGHYTVDGGSLSITLGPSTLVACPEGSLADTFLANLVTAASYVFAEDRLTVNLLMDGTMQFTAQVTALPGTTWEVTGYNNGRGGVVSPILETTLTAAFGADGQIAGSAGCNRYRAAYETSDARITLGLPATTRMACPEPEGVMAQEAAFLAALQTAATYLFRGNRLELRAAGGALAVALQRREP
jgi:heat shock protein HslJ